jgi:hypothetical protein
MSPAEEPAALAKADERIAEARRRIAAQEWLIARGRLSQPELDAAYSLLHSMRRTLEVLENHRHAMAKVLRGLRPAPVSARQRKECP